MKNIPYKKELHNTIKIINRNAKKTDSDNKRYFRCYKNRNQQLESTKKLFNLNDLISDIVEDYSNQPESENIKIKYEFTFPNRNDDKYGYKKHERSVKKEINPTYILADRTRITQKLSNLLNNAIKFTSSSIGEEGIIKIIVEKKMKEKKEKCIFMLKIMEKGNKLLINNNLVIR